jgi:hypothetical protein
MMPVGKCIVFIIGLNTYYRPATKARGIVMAFVGNRLIQPRELISS